MTAQQSAWSLSFNECFSLAEKAWAAHCEAKHLKIFYVQQGFPCARVFMPAPADEALCFSCRRECFIKVAPRMQRQPQQVPHLWHCVILRYEHLQHLQQPLHLRMALVDPQQPPLVLV